MSTTVERAIQALRSCEAELRELVGEAAQGGDYDATVWITDHAKRLASWLDDAKGLGATSVPRELAESLTPAAKLERDRTIEVGVLAGFLGCELESQMVQEVGEGMSEIDQLVVGGGAVAARPLRARDIGYLLDELSRLLEKQRKMAGMSESDTAYAALLIKNWAKRFSHFPESEKDRPVAFRRAMHLVSDLQIVFREVFYAQVALAQFARKTGSHPPTPLPKSVEWTAPALATADTAEQGAAKKRRQHRRKPGYPKFYRLNGDLVKVGWSKKRNSEYSHKAPKRLVDVVARAVADAGAGGAVFNTDHLLPVYDPEGGHEVPTYQAYLTLRWLRDKGLVERHGRRGYSLKDPQGLQAALDKLWSSLPEPTRP
jgi:hypothetical protein